MEENSGNSKSSGENEAPPPARAPADDFRRRHLRVGWTALAVFVTLGMLLEGMHGFKVGFYLDVDNSTRRLMWTLAHSHGTLLGLVNLAFAALFRELALNRRWLATTSHLLVAATALMPSGFFLGGLRFHGGDPGLGVLLVPIGGAMLVVALIGIAWATR